MKIYKFGGASVRNAAGVRNLQHIVSLSDDNLIVVISAMGKTTNALERVLDAIRQGDTVRAGEQWRDIVEYHSLIADELGVLAQVKPLFVEALSHINQVAACLSTMSYDEMYDQIVSVGEWLSTRIVSIYLAAQGFTAEWLDMTAILRTDDTYRDANIDFDTTGKLLHEAIAAKPAHCYIAQGFIGGTATGKRTTLGREGSDYTAAVLGNLMDADSVTIWKDVPGILNADPRLEDNTVLIPELSYKDAVELAYSGAQIIHPKTIRPLENKHIPLYVKPFGDPTAAGSVIHANPTTPITVPIYIWRKNQMLITLRAKDFAFALEESLNTVFDIIHRHRLKVSLIQSSAVSISVCVDNTRYVPEALAQMQQQFRVNYNENLSLLTIRGKNDDILRRAMENRVIMLSQTTRRTARLVVEAPMEIK